MLDFRIETFLSVCRNMSYTKAANELYITQPAVSQHIKSLEKHYGAKLFFYNGKKLILTEQGELLRQFFESVHHDSARIEDMVRHIHTKRVIRLGATMSIGGFYLPEKLSRYILAHPEYNVTLTIQDTRDLLKMLDNGEVDFSMCEGYLNRSKYDNLELEREKILCLCGKDYDIPETVPIEQLFSHRIILRENGSGNREVFERMLKAQGYELNNFPNRCVVNAPHTIIQLLLLKTGISFLYQTVGEKLLLCGELREIEIPNFQMEHAFNAVWNKDSVFADTYRRIVAELIGSEQTES